MESWLCMHEDFFVSWQKKCLDKILSKILSYLYGSMPVNSVEAFNFFSVLWILIEFLFQIQVFLKFL